MVGSAYAIGAGAGPFAGGLLTAAAGFQWASTIYCAALVALSVASALVFVFWRPAERGSSEWGTSEDDDFYSIV